MSSLPETQRAFAADVLGEGAAQLGVQIGSGRFSPERLLQIYRNNHFISLTEALRDCHPVTAELLGEGFFNYAAHGYIQRHPSRSGNLHDFGDQFAEHLTTLDGMRGFPFVPDVARLEWCWHRAFHAADATPIDQETLAAVPGEAYPALRFELHPSASLLRSGYPIAQIWAAHQPGGDLSTVDLDGGGDCVLVIRPHLEVQVQRLVEAEYIFLSALDDGAALANAAEAALDEEEDWPLQEALGRHLAGGTLTGLGGD